MLDSCTISIRRESYKLTHTDGSDVDLEIKHKNFCPFCFY